MPAGQFKPGLVTRGFVAGTQVTRGMSVCDKQPIIPRVIAAIRAKLRGGTSKLKKTVWELIVTAQLISFNATKPDYLIAGNEIKLIGPGKNQIKTKSNAELVNTKVNKISERIVIHATKLNEDNNNGNN